jgi:xylan 1,4-beta-xylosidase
MIYRLSSYIIYFYLITLSNLHFACTTEKNENPIGKSAKSYNTLLVADPFVLYHDGFYYLYGTSGADADKGIPVYKSTDLRHWEGPIGKGDGGDALSKGSVYGEKGFWAPHVTYYQNKFYMFYTAEEHIAVATSNSPLGPFVQNKKLPLHPEIKEIDPHVFIDDDGKKYLYFVRFDNGNKTYGAELNDDLLSIKENTIVNCISQSQNWEIASGAQWPVTEAPAVLKHAGTYYLFYTGNDFRHKKYNVGYATSKSPLGPWVKNAQNPIIPDEQDVFGTGHCDFVSSTSNQIFMFYHAHFSETSVSPRKIVYSILNFEQDGEGEPDGIKVGEKIFPEIEVKGN